MGYLDGKVALVTGASRGIGRAVALKFAAEGAKVAVNYLTSEEEAHQVVQEIESRGGEALAVRADVARKADVVAMVERICEEWGGVDILMNMRASRWTDPRSVCPRRIGIASSTSTSRGPFFAPRR